MKKNNFLAELVDHATHLKTFAWVGIPVALVFLYLDLQNIEVGYLQLYSLNEYAFLASLSYMYESLIIGKWSGLFAYGFYQYGYVYFFLNFVAALPGLWTENYSWAIAAPRIVTSVFGVGLLYLVYRFALLYVPTISALLTAAIVASLPAFLFGSSWFHPDIVFTFFIVASVLYLARDNWRFEGYFQTAVIAFALAVACKYQAITAVPLLGMYIYYDHLRTFRLTSLLLPTKRLILSLITILGVFIVCNPYIFHPMGWNVFYTALTWNINHVTSSAVEIVSFGTKVSYSLSDFYINVIFLFIGLLGLLWLIRHYFTTQSRSLFSVLAITGTVNLAYLFFGVNSSWFMYFFPTMILCVLALIYFVIQVSKPWQVFILSFVLVGQLVVYSSSYKAILIDLTDGSFHPDYTTYTHSENAALDTFLITELRGQTDSDDVILLSPYTPFSFQALDLTFNQVLIIYGPLDRSGLDASAYLAGQRSYWKDIKTDEELMRTFRPADIIILRKNIPYIDTALIPLMTDTAAYEKAAHIVTELYDGTLGYSVLAENELVVIFAKK